MCRNPLHCVVPPFVLNRVAKRGSERQREWALRTLSADSTMRHARSVNAKARGRKGAREGHDALAATAPGRRNRIICDAQNSWEVTNLKRVRDEDDGPTGDPAVDEAFDGFGATWDFWQNVFSRDSIDDENMPLRGVVHFGEEYPNAFWDGRRMAFGDGDGDGELFLRFTKSLDVIAHELGHGVVEDEGALEYHGQSGALNEHFADVAGAMVSQYKLGQTAAEADWLIGADLLGPELEGKALRSMKAPGTAYDDDTLGKDPQPAHWRDYVRTFEDNGGVHINSGIANKAFYLLAINLGGNSWQAPGQIWYDALRSPLLTPTASFRSFARLTHRAARQRFGPGSDETRAVREAWAEVGVRWE